MSHADCKLGKNKHSILTHILSVSYLILILFFIVFLARKVVLRLNFYYCHKFCWYEILTQTPNITLNKTMFCAFVCEQVYVCVYVCVCLWECNIAHYILSLSIPKWKMTKAQLQSLKKWNTFMLQFF